MTTSLSPMDDDDDDDDDKDDDDGGAAAALRPGRSWHAPRLEPSASSRTVRASPRHATARAQAPNRVSSRARISGVMTRPLTEMIWPRSATSMPTSNPVPSSANGLPCV
jgi:hypothetical protein